MITTSSDRLDLALLLRRWRPRDACPGRRSERLRPAQASTTASPTCRVPWASPQLAKLQRVVGARRAAAAVYAELLEGTPPTAPARIAGSEPVHQSYVTVLPEGIDRTRLISAAAERGVQVQIGTVGIPFTSYYREKYGIAVGRFPVTETWIGRHLSLPLYPGISREQQQTVVSTVLGLL